jgi:hypothetical protein
MPVLGAIVEISALAVLEAGKQLMLNNAVAPHQVSHDYSRHISQALQRSPEEELAASTFRRA